MNITALVPCRAGSMRIPNKNTKPFGPSSLIEIKLDQLLRVDLIDTIILSSNDPIIFDLWQKKYQGRVEFHQRPEVFASNTCSTNQLITHFIESLDYEHLLWTHTTSPFLDSRSYAQVIQKYQKVLSQNYDSLLSANRCQEFAFKENGEALNYDSSVLGRWPRTQEIDPFYVVNSAVFLCAKDIMAQYNDRIGKRPYFYPLTTVQGIDVDWPEDFTFAEQLWTQLFDKSKSPLKAASAS